jgi:hypothetical protein
VFRADGQLLAGLDGPAMLLYELIDSGGPLLVCPAVD